MPFLLVIGIGLFIIAVISGLVWVFCISFGIQFSWWYILGLWATYVLHNLLFKSSK